MKKIFVLLGAIALTLTLASATGKCGDTKNTMKCQAGKCASDKNNTKMKCAAGKCGNAAKEAPAKPAPAKGKCGQGKCG